MGMARRWWALLAVFYLCSLQASGRHQRRALYPAAHWIKRGAYSLINPTFLQSEDDSKLLYEILLAGMQIRGEEHNLLIPDEELASLRSVKKLEVICEDVLPKKLSDIQRRMAELADRRQHLSWQDFERTVLTLVYTSQILAQMSDQNQKELWMEAMVQLVRALQRDLKPF
ncbi:protein FAM180A [Cyprinodon tularosa]|uniref:protein FAM180A n=1 Tax=Cyprinodon tularosa TaxID=77115 RepID=UPI0018E1E7D3|nr:protein FAM180A [Cyprinodon tularosa]